MGRKRLEFKNSFTDRIFPEPNTGCWIWSGPIDKNGYGNCNVYLNGQKITKAHRASFLIHKGYIDNTLLVCHKCDNPWCVNPDHLFLGTRSDNTIDSIKKGRAFRGKRNRKLTEKQVLDIRLKLSLGVRQLTIAKQYNVWPQTISAICCGKSWL